MKQKNTYFLLAVFFIGLLGLNACKKEAPYGNYQPVNRYDGTIYDYIKSQPNHFQYLLFVLEKAGLATMLQQDSLTFFVPTDQSLLAAMNEYNVYRRTQGLPSAALNDIDSSSWRSILTRYLVRGELKLKDFEEQDGLMMTTLSMRQMHGQLIKHNASGAKETGPETIQFSDLNGSKYTSDWVSSFVSTLDIQTKNGIIDILETRHVLGFNYFISKVKEPQNIYSEERTYASGSITSPDMTVRLWKDRVKKLTAINANTVETEAADLLASGYIMRLTILPNDSIMLQAAPNSYNLTIEKSGPCYFDPVTLTYTLNYHYISSSEYQVISEKINYISNTGYVH